MLFVQVGVGAGMLSVEKFLQKTSFKRKPEVNQATFFAGSKSGFKKFDP